MLNRLFFDSGNRISELNMNLSVRVIIETVNEAGEVKSHSVISIKSVTSPFSLADLGYRQMEQVEMLQHL